MRFASLGSGSEGNALLVAVGQTRVLMDCGFGLQDTVMRLERLGVSAEQLNGIVVTHEHGDHISGVAQAGAQIRSPGLAYAWHFAHAKRGFCQSRHYRNQSASDVCHRRYAGQPYPVPHDAAEPVQYVFSDGVRRLGVLTDAGSAHAAY